SIASTSGSHGGAQPLARSVSARNASGRRALYGGSTSTISSPFAASCAKNGASSSSSTSLSAATAARSSGTVSSSREASSRKRPKTSCSRVRDSTSSSSGLRGEEGL